MKYVSTKTFGHEQGLSCAFRQWRADSQCKLLHGYALSFKFVFQTKELDDNNWVVDFGGLKGLKQLLIDNFDHTTVIAEDDPELDWFQTAHNRGILKLVKLPAGGCEKFAQYAFELAAMWLYNAGYTPRCKLVSVEVSEHGANSAVYFGNE